MACEYFSEAYGMRGIKGICESPKIKGFEVCENYFKSFCEVRSEKCQFLYSEETEKTDVSTE
jgi:hypothetical protein